ncbi:type I-E CRISPR-associated protein Cse2/CasB [Zoogloeaceae bacteirum Par-f-2]|jgi:CRISPR system Cascade subunit CasB|uniref:type I-E CRISPR-associated protein Cse2/CasB n=1 Tax=Pseudothauera hydrothermalis TaxID=2184083 RepID=UPI000C7D4A05|nr:type I-E CRISPR-associated protein Cse2/CasB [Pseudothauera hydrothermalis]AUM01273.1 type I-E CRISPR-associated protein Cse2/CasB [Rhodocyclaceae bacterium]AVZ80424.1 type I-E CRISPR-associated protein Cse2/CasB [Zoogloeaceae bacteirum Par-f-2]
MSAYLDWLEELNERDARVRAVLRRSLAFDPGAFPAAYPYVEPFLKDQDSHWRRQVHYLVAALWAAHWKVGRTDPAQPIGEAVARYAMRHHSPEQLRKGAFSTERRFIALLDADADELPYRLRQMVALLKDQAIDFDALLADLLRWHAPDKRIQHLWARQFYRALHKDTDLPAEPETEEESA